MIHRRGSKGTHRKLIRFFFLIRVQLKLIPLKKNNERIYQSLNNHDKKWTMGQLHKIPLGNTYLEMFKEIATIASKLAFVAAKRAIIARLLRVPGNPALLRRFCVLEKTLRMPLIILGFRKNRMNY